MTITFQPQMLEDPHVRPGKESTNRILLKDMKRKYIDESWYIIDDGTSFYGVLGMNVEDTLQGDSDIEIVSGPYKEYPEERIEQLNENNYN